MSSAISTDKPAAPAAPLMPTWLRLAFGTALLAIWAVVLVLGLKARLRASTVLLFLTGGLLMWTFLWLYRTLAALAAERPDPPAQRVGGARRRELDREKRILLKAIKELEFDHAMGKLSDGDFQELVGRYRARAIAVLRQLDEGDLSYRELVERDLARRLGDAAPGPVRGAASGPAPASGPPDAASAGCPTCATVNDPDAAFCKKCGTRLGAAEEAAP
ncbi:MAG TPA: zinc ribbon domain-containing protein [Polyangia bacterium]|jgi:hypothetical protein